MTSELTVNGSLALVSEFHEASISTAAVGLGWYFKEGPGVLCMP